LRYIIPIAIIFILLFYACNTGLDPTKEIYNKPESFLKGRIIYLNGKDSWPSKDSVFAVRVVAFKNYPPDDIISEIISGNAYFIFESLPLFVDSSDFSITIPDPPVELKYIAAALQYADTLTAQLAIGVFTESGDNTKPSSINIQPGKEYFIYINVDFNNLPPQPFD
jgi:hypothetical protein